MEVQEEFIPIPPGQAAFIKKQNLINDLFGQVGYEIRGEYLYFTENIIRTKNVTEVDMRLVVMDFDRYDDYDILPLSPDMAEDIIQRTFNLLMGTPVPDKRVDSKSEEPEQTRSLGG